MGWSIGSTSLFKQDIRDASWRVRGNHLVFAVKGTANTAPTASDSTVTTNEDTPHVFTAADFNFMDTDAGDSLASVKIVTLPAAGALKLGIDAVTTDQDISLAEINGGPLTFTPAANANGDDYASFTFKVTDGAADSADATMTVNVTAVNDPATGSPAITVQGGGAVEVGATLVATGTIADADGVGGFSYQWIRVDGSNRTDISGETTSTYVVTVADEGKQLEVEVSFTDDGGHAESVTSAPTAAVPVPVTPTVTLVLSPASISENGGSSTVTATLDTRSSAATTVQVSAVAVSPAVAADFSLSGTTTLTIAAGDTTSTGTVMITAVDNNVDAANKTVTVSGTATNTDRLGVTGPDSKTLTITDNDVGSTAVTLSVSPASVPEGAGATTVTVTAELNESARTEVTAVAVSVNAGTATETTDFAAVTNFTITIAAGMTSATGTFTLTPAADTIDEPDETVAVSATVSGLSVLPMGGAIVMIEDDDDTPQATLELSPDSIAENGGASTVTATLDHASSVVTTIEISAPTATDYSLTSNKTLTIAPGATTSTGTVQITARGNTIYTGDKQVTVQGTATNARAIVQPAPQTLTIREDDTASTTITLTAAPGAISEGATGNAQRVTVTAQLNAAARPDATAVTVQVAGDTADEGTDFTAVTEFTITIAAGMTSATGMFTLAPLDDDTDEPEETVRITGTTVASGLSVAPATGLIVAITDNDPAPQVSLVLTPASISESGGTSTVTATLDRPSSEDTTIAVAAAAGTNTVAADFLLSGTTLTIVAGDMASTGTVTIAADNDNDLADGAKHVTVSGTVTNTQGSTAPAPQTLTITDDEAVATGVILTVSPGTVSEGAGQVVTVTAALDGGVSTTPVPVAVSVTGGTAAAATDFGAVTDFTITIPANTRSETGTFTLTPIDDDIDEPDETVVVSGTATGLSGSQSTVTIEDNDDTPQVMLVLTPASIPENGGSSTVTATLDHPSSEETVVTISAAPVGSADANDFTLTGNTVLRIAVGQTMSAGTVTIEAEDNTTDHPNRVVTVSGSATNDLAIVQPDAASLTITDDEQTSTGFTIAASPTSVSEGAAGSARQVTVTATLDKAARETATVVTLSVSEGTAIAGTDFTEVQDVELTIQPGATEGTATFNLIPIEDTIDEPDETVQIVGMSADLGSSGAIDILIEDNDAMPQVTLVLAPASISENGGSSTVTATLDHPSSEETVVTISAAPVGSADANDFTLSGNRVLRIAFGETTSTGIVTIEAEDNAIDHPDREVTVSGSAANDLGIVQPAAETLTIEDNEVTSTLVTLSISLTNVTEGDAGQTVTVTGMLNEAARETEAVVNIKVSPLTAEEGVDFTEVPNFTLTIPAGETTGTAAFTLSPIDDDIDEPVETLEVEGSSPTQGLDVSGEDLPMTITDNDDSPQVTLTATPAQIGEDGGTTTITATLDHPSSEFTSVTVSVTPSANASTADFNVSGNMVLEIQAGDTSSTGDTVTVTAIDNEVDDPAPKNLSVTATVSNSLGFVAPDPLLLLITDDEAGSNNILLGVMPSQVPEGTSGTVVTVTASLDGAARAEAVPVAVSVAGGTATAVTDFAAVSSFTITIPANATSETAEFTLSPVDDDIDEPDETVLLTGTTTVSGLADGAASVTIADDDPEPVVTLELTPASISENGGETTVTATLDRPSTEVTTITVTAAPVSPAVAADFTQSGTTLTIAAGAMSSTGAVTIAANDNETYTGNKSVTISGTAGNSQGIEQPTAQTLTIEEDDTASTQVTFTVSPEEIQEDDSPQQVTVTAMLDGAARAVDTAAALTVQGATAVAGTDFTAVSPFTLTIPAGATTGTAGFTLTPIDDSTDEPDRTVRVNLPASLPSLTVAPAGWLEVTIADDDPTPEAVLVLTPASIREAGGSSTVTATLDRPSAEATTIEVTATPVSPADADDFTQSGTTLTIAAGATSSTGTVTVTARDNTIDHEDREVTVSGVAINALAIVQAPEQTLSIADDDDTSAVVTLTVVSSTAPDPVAEGASATVTVTATLDKAAREADAVIDVVVSGGTLGQSGRAREGADFSAVTDFAVTIPAGAAFGAASFTLITLDDEVKETDETVLVTGTVNSTQTQGPALQVEPAGGVAVAISDDDPDPAVTLVLTPASISENGGSSTVTAELDRPYTGIVTVELTTTPGAATVADDFILSSSSLTIAAEDVRSSGTAVTIAGVNNILAESPKTVTVAGVADVTDVVQPTAKVLTITDDDTPSTGITLTVTPDRVAEDATTESVTVTATLDGAARSSDTPVIVSVIDGTASAGTDFATVADFTITIADGAVSGTHTFTLEPADDETDAPDRTILVRGQTSAAGLEVVPARGLEVTIVDDDPAPVVVLALAPMEISENGGTSTVTATLDRPSSAAISVDVQAAPVTPAVAGDFRLSSNRVLRFAAGQTASAGTVTVAAVDNDIAADDRQVEVSGTARTDDFRLGVDQPAALRLTIEDDEQPSTEVTLTVSPGSISEGATGTARRVTVTAELNGAARETVTAVAMTVTAGTATQGEDFAAVSDFTVTIPIGQRSGAHTFTLTPLEDVIDEPDETVRLTGSLSGSGLRLVQPSGGLTVTIKDNEPEPKVTLVLTPDSIREDGGETTVTATLDSPSTEVTTITVTATPVSPAVEADFQLNGTTLTIPPGATESTGTVTIEAVDNEVEAPNKRVTVSATAQNAFGVGDPPDRTLTITDNEFPSRTVTLSVSPTDIREGVSQTVTVTAELDGAARPDPTEIAITVGAGTAAATDFSPVTGFTLTIPAEQKSGSANVHAGAGGRRDGRAGRDGGGPRTDVRTDGGAVGRRDGDHRGRRPLAGSDAGADPGLDLREWRVEHGDGGARPSVERSDGGDGERGGADACCGRRLPAARDAADDPRRPDGEHRDGDALRREQRVDRAEQAGGGVGRGRERPGDRAAASRGSDDHGRRPALDDGDADGVAGQGVRERRREASDGDRGTGRGAGVGGHGGDAEGDCGPRHGRCCRGDPDDPDGAAQRDSGADPDAGR